MDKERHRDRAYKYDKHIQRYILYVTDGFAVIVYDSITEDVDKKAVNEIKLQCHLSQELQYRISYLYLHSEHYGEHTKCKCRDYLSHSDYGHDILTKLRCHLYIELRHKIPGIVADRKCYYGDRQKQQELKEIKLFKPLEKALLELCDQNTYKEKMY